MKLLIQSDRLSAERVSCTRESTAGCGLGIGGRRRLARWRWLLAIMLLSMLAASHTVFAAKGGVPGPPSGGETSNNLSVPGVVVDSSIPVEAYWSPPDVPILGVHYSYGCDTPQTVDIYSYPNTTCALLNVDGVASAYYNAEECTDEGMPCDGYEVSRIYWQKVDVNEWSADQLAGDGFAQSVDYVDWGDALESVSWTERSVIRVETQPWASTLPGFDPVIMPCVDAAGDTAEADCLVGLQMWHVSGQGITEHWGVRATEPDPMVEGDPSVAWNYDSPFQIIKSGNARLNIAKMSEETATCPEAGNEDPGDLPPVIPAENWNGAGWNGTCQYLDNPYTVELSVGGKYVYGYNLRMGELEDMAHLACDGDWEKTGWWRLTFYTSNDDVVFDNGLAPNVAPPSSPAAVRSLPRSWFIETTADPGEPEPEAVLLLDGVPIIESEDPSVDGRLYKPVIDTVNNLSYLDICIVAKTQGGGGGKKDR